MLEAAGSPDRLRNLAVLLPPPPSGPELGRGYCRYAIRLVVSSGAVVVESALPEFSLTSQGLKLTGTFTGSASTKVTWDFGDGSPLANQPSAEHTYARPGRYEVLARLAAGGRLSEYRSAVVMSASRQLPAPVIVVPQLGAGPLSAEGTVPLSVTLPAGVSGVSLECTAGRARGWADAGSVTLQLKPGRHLLTLLATRKLSAQFYGKQRYEPESPVELSRGRIATNRTFDDKGDETTAAPSAFTTRIFGDGSTPVSPVDRWTLELPVAANPWLLTVSSSDVAEFDGSEFSDALLTLEFLSA
jgi:PKD repeat protein